MMFFTTFDTMEIDGDTADQSEEKRPQLDGLYEMESPNNDELDDTPVVFESEDNRNDSRKMIARKMRMMICTGQSQRQN